MARKQLKTPRPKRVPPPQLSPVLRPLRLPKGHGAKETLVGPLVTE